MAKGRGLRQTRDESSEEKKGGKREENKVALIRSCQERLRSQSYLGGTGRKSNLALAVSLSNIGAISCHRSE